MAEATTATREKVVEQTVLEQLVILTLTKDEANVLRDITSLIGGSPSASRRGLVSKISEALNKVGIHGETLSDLDEKSAFKNKIYFKDRLDVE